MIQANSPVALPDEYTLGDWRVLRSQNRLEWLSDRARVVRLEPKAMDVLCALAHHAPQTLSRAQLLDTVWSGRVVVEGTLSRAIRQLRIALGDDVRAPVYIETVSKRGYRLLMKPLIAQSVQAQTAVDAVGESAAPLFVQHAATPSAARIPQRLFAGRGWVVALALGVISVLGALTQSIESPPRGAARILWVDDRPENNHREIARLKGMGLRVETAASNAEAAQRLQSRRYDVLISDIKRGAEAGLAGLSLPREALPDRNSLPPVVYYVGNVGSARTADGYPVTNDPEQLMALVSELAGSARAINLY